MLRLKQRLLVLFSSCLLLIAMVLYRQNRYSPYEPNVYSVLNEAFLATFDPNIKNQEKGDHIWLISTTPNNRICDESRGLGSKEYEFGPEFFPISFAAISREKLEEHAYSDLEWFSWGALQKKYDKYISIMEFSEVVFANENTATISISVLYDDGHGFGAKLSLKKKQNRWMVTNTTSCWLS